MQYVRVIKLFNLSVNKIWNNKPWGTFTVFYMGLFEVSTVMGIIIQNLKKVKRKEDASSLRYLLL